MIRMFLSGLLAISAASVKAQTADSRPGWNQLYLALNKTNSSEDIKKAVNLTGVNGHGLGGRTPLQMAICANNAKAMAILIHLGASLSEADDVGNTPVDYAVTLADTNSLRVLLRVAGSVTASNEMRCEAWFLRDPIKLSLFINYRWFGYRPQDVRRMIQKLSGMPAKYIADTHRSANLVLLKDRFGRTIFAKSLLSDALSAACSEASAGYAKQLIALGADPRIKDTSGRLCLNVAISDSWTPETQSHLELIRLLLKDGANPYAVDRSGKSAVEVAKTEGLGKVSRLLLASGLGRP